MLSRTERVLLVKLIRNRIAVLESSTSPDVAMQLNTLHELQTKIENGGELLTTPELRLALDVASEPDNRHCRWIVYTSNISTLADILNAMHVRHAITRKDMVNV